MACTLWSDVRERAVCVHLLKENPCLWPVLSSDRVEQMTKTYSDMEVVTQLLAEVGVRSLFIVPLFKKSQM